MSILKRTSQFKSSWKQVRKNSRWNAIFSKPVPFDYPKRAATPWEVILDCLFNDLPIPAYFYSHPIVLTKLEKKQLKKRLPNSFAKAFLSDIQGLDLHFDGKNGDHLLIYAKVSDYVFLSTESI